jgi:hypothetical protein
MLPTLKPVASSETLPSGVLGGATPSRFSEARLVSLVAAGDTFSAVGAVGSATRGSALGSASTADDRSDDAGDDDEERDQRRARRASTTDPEVRVMKMADGGWRPAVNVQYATDVASGVVVGVDVANGGNDQPQPIPMVDQLADHYDTVPGAWLADSGFVSRKPPAETAAIDVDLVSVIRRRWPWIAVRGASSRARARAIG